MTLEVPVLHGCLPAANPAPEFLSSRVCQLHLYPRRHNWTTCFAFLPSQAQSFRLRGSNLWVHNLLLRVQFHALLILCRIHFVMMKVRPFERQPRKSSAMSYLPPQRNPLQSRFFRKLSFLLCPPASHFYPGQSFLAAPLIR